MSMFILQDMDGASFPALLLIYIGLFPSFCGKWPFSTQELPHLGKNPQNLSKNLHKLCLAALYTEAMRQEAL